MPFYGKLPLHTEVLDIWRLKAAGQGVNATEVNIQGERKLFFLHSFSSQMKNLSLNLHRNTL